MDDSAHREAPCPGAKPGAARVLGEVDRIATTGRAGTLRAHSAGDPRIADRGAARDDRADDRREDSPRIRARARAPLSGAPLRDEAIARTAERSAIVQATTHHIRPEALDEVSITEAGFVRAGFRRTAEPPPAMVLRRTYEPILLAGPGERAASDRWVGCCAGARGRGLRSPGGRVRAGQPSCRHDFEDALLIAAAQASAAARERADFAASRSTCATTSRSSSSTRTSPSLVVGRDRSVRVVSGAFARHHGPRPGRARRVGTCCGWPDRANEPACSSAFVQCAARPRGPALRAPAPAGRRRSRAASSSRWHLFSTLKAARRASSPSVRTAPRSASSKVRCIHAEKLATLGQLAAGIVHEINNPLDEHLRLRRVPARASLSRSGAEASDLQAQSSASSAAPSASCRSPGTCSPTPAHRKRRRSRSRSTTSSRRRTASASTASCAKRDVTVET